MIVLLFTILCTNQVYSMEPGGLVFSLEQQEIIDKGLAQTNLVAAIKMIKKLEYTSGVQLYTNGANFIKVVHMLADRFNTDTLIVAQEFKRQKPFAEKGNISRIPPLYVKIAERLKWLVSMGFVDQLKEQLILSADVNVTFNGQNLLIWAIRTQQIHSEGKEAVVRVLLAYKINPHFKDYSGKTALDYALQLKVSNKIIKLLQRAMKK